MASDPTTRPVLGVIVGHDEDSPPGFDLLEADADLRLIRAVADLESVLDSLDVLVVDDFRTTVLADVGGFPERAPRLRWIHASSAGVDAIPSAALTAPDITVTNAAGVFDRSIAEWVAAVILLFAKDLHTTLALQSRAEWQHRESQRLEGSRVLVVGAGSIGHAVARTMRTFGTEVRGVARSAREDPEFGRIAPASELDTHLAWADWVVVTLPLTEATRGMFGPAQFAAMRSSAHIVNVGRGAVVDERALLDALRAGSIAGAALDVFETEPLPSRHPLWGLRNVVISPHMSGDFVGWRRELTQLLADNLRRWKEGEPLRNVVVPAADHAPVVQS